MNKALVSVIIPVYNRSKMLTEAVLSILSQSYGQLEIVIVDDGSFDETINVLKHLEARHPDVIRVVRQSNQGPGIARNAGLAKSSGEFIQYLDSDDLLEPTKLEKQAEALEAHPEADVCYCATLRKNPRTGELEPWARTAERIDNLFPSFLPKRGWATLTPLWRRSACERIGPWGDFRVLEDWEHDLRAGMIGIKPVQVAEALCIVRDHSEQRASGMNTGFTRELTRDFFRAHESVWRHMKAHGLTDWSYVQRFSRTMFWVARLCGSFGLVNEAEAALSYTDEMTRLNDQPSSTRSFRVVRSMLGWSLASKVSESTRNVIRREQPARTVP